MKKNVMMIVNPVSGAIDKSDFITATERFSHQENFNFVSYETSGMDDASQIRALFNRYKPERIIIAGGDGTIKLAADALENEEVIFGILSAGSANGLATDLGLPKDLEESLAIAFKNNFISIDTILINGNKSLHLSDLGLNALLIKNYEHSAVRGKLGYAMQAINTLIEDDEPFHAVITVNGEQIECDARMIVIANSQKYGTGVVINPYGLMNDGLFELIILKNLDLLVLGKIITGNMPMDTDDVLIISTDKATIETNVPVNFQIDGEYCGSEMKLDIAVSSKKIKVAIP
ncbi:diacylglycerol kinase [Flavobacterium sp. F-380]|jgi:YegS/Rv2252/BmrU family lipid kinase|uniref:Diacylglycerol kinase n=1 Tax=Flavobacterium kayseriense TaxID=2764714 RepID=A0ABR7J2Y7_9FLAO|nr:diacylglycerol kinase family protein [Flavobacterium kayseriense]MBC5839930.1 diacylglycerol kinase [Flavobacterium kayseriense]MBC5847400.1 diacylglycerol kinase [Flavobacterium kayseriense]